MFGFTLYPYIISTKVYDFNLEDYQYQQEVFPNDKVLGTIENAEIAKEKSENVWIGIYGENVLNKKPYVVSYDDVNEVFHVHGTSWKGNVPHILIRKADGKVLAVWHTK